MMETEKMSETLVFNSTLRRLIARDFRTQPITTGYEAGRPLSPFARCEEKKNPCPAARNQSIYRLSYPDCRKYKEDDENNNNNYVAAENQKHSSTDARIHDKRQKTRFKVGVSSIKSSRRGKITT
jgi:hypothetical protein